MIKNFKNIDTCFLKDPSFNFVFMRYAICGFSIFTLRRFITQSAFCNAVILNYYCNSLHCFPKHTVRNLHFLSKNSTLISRENCRFFWEKNSWICCGFGLFSCWQLWFHEKNCQKNLDEVLVKMLVFFVKIEFLDKNLTFRIVC